MPPKQSLKKCPKCKKHAGQEIIYGMPTEKDAEKIRQGLAILGGFTPKNGPVFKWNCSRCGYVWGNVLS